MSFRAPVSLSILSATKHSESDRMTSRLSFILPLLGATTLTWSACAQAAAPAQGLTLESMQKLVGVGAPRLSPDGEWIAYTVSRVDADEDKSVTNLWMISWDGKEDVQLTYGKESVGDPRWSPDGRWIAFTTERESEGGAKGSQVWVLDRRGGEAHPVTDVKETLGDYRWSPDGHRLLLQLTEKEEPDQDKDKAGPEGASKPKPPKPIVLDRYHFKQDIDGYLTDKQPHLFIYDLATKTLSKLTTNPATGPNAYAEEDAEWSPDGTQIAFVSNQSTPDPDRVANPDLFVVAAAPASAPRRLTTFTGEDTGPLAWTPDGTRIVFREGLTPHYSIYDESRLAMVAATGGAPVILAPKLDQWVGPPVLAPGGEAVLTTVSDDRQEYVAEVSMAADGPAKRITTGSGSALALNAAAGHVAVLWTSDLTAPEIYALEGGTLRKLTAHNDAPLAGVTLAPTEDISAKTSDGNEVHGLLTLPVGYVAGTKAPLLLRIHGGPTAQDAHAFSIERQLFAAKGYAVLNVNYRGSTGRGHAYSEAINADWGDKEVLDLLASVDAAVATGRIDPNRLGVGGWSYGGILTDYTIATTTRFKAASSGAGMGNLLGFYGVDQYILQYENELGPPWKNLKAYVKLSYPFFHADRIKTPTLFMGGDKDFNVPLEGGEQMYQALKSVGTTAELIVYPGEFHGFKRPSFIKDRYQRWFDWYDKYVRDPTPAAK
jgi:dipeptidyl aminopeptidase/acylaminoacyl peptidase